MSITAATTPALGKFGTSQLTGSHLCKRSTTLSRTSTTRYLSPLRYPGGKGSISPFVADLIAGQRRRPNRYVEPFAGGAGVGLRLLFDEHVDEIVLNDLDLGIAAFWRAVFEHTRELAKKVRTTLPTLDE